jgi:hypothetical protein
MYLRVRKEGGILSGSEIKIIYHADNQPCASHAMSLIDGDLVVAHGLAVSDDAMSVCGSNEHLLRRASD